jgi:type IV fimbrial biogenesis protein FimT
MKLSNPKSSGFSLVELMVVIALLGIIATYAISSYQAWIQNTRIRTAAESIQGGIQLARAEAVSRNASVQFDFRGTKSAWTVCASPVAPGACPNPDGATTIQSRAVSDAGPYVFNSFGTMTSPVPGGVTGLVSIGVDVSTSVLPSAESRDLRIVIGVGGSSRMCDPDPGVSTSDPRKCP